MSDSMVERIKRRTESSRANVPERTTSFLQITEATETTTPDSPSLPDIEDGLIETAARRQIRLATDLDSRIDEFCKQHKITIETYLEALHTNCQNDFALLEKVILEAKERLLERKKAGRIRRLRTQIKQSK